MKRTLLAVPLIFLSGIVLSGCSFKSSPSALQINTTPAANVFIDGKMIGKSPYQANDLKPAELSIKLIPESTTSPLSSWEGKVKLNAGVLTLIERDFSSTEAGSSGQILSLEKTKDKKIAALTVVSDPDGALVKIDGEAKGFAPLSLNTIGEGDHQISVSKDGYTEKLVKARAVLGYKLVVNVKLAQEGADNPTPTASPSAETTPGAQVTPKVNTQTPAKPYVKISDTPTGWLRVRQSASTTGEEIAKVKPGEMYSLLEEESGWFKIKVNQTTEGWVSSQYATKFE